MKHYFPRRHTRELQGLRTTCREPQYAADGENCRQFYFLLRISLASSVFADANPRSGCRPGMGLMVSANFRTPAPKLGLVDSHHLERTNLIQGFINFSARRLL